MSILTVETVTAVTELRTDAILQVETDRALAENHYADLLVFAATAAEVERIEFEQARTLALLDRLAVAVEYVTDRTECLHLADVAAREASPEAARALDHLADWL